MFNILDKTITKVHIDTYKINGMPIGIFRFTRLTKTSMLPIEVTIAEINGKLVATSSTEEKYRLEEDDKYFYYKNDLVFDKQKIMKEFSKLENKEVDTGLVEFMNNKFGIDLSGISHISAFKFDRVILIEDMPISSNVTSNGYMWIFSDIATGTLKIGFYSGDVRHLHFDEYIERITSYGAANIKNDIKISQNKNKILVKNLTPFKIKLKIRQYDYKQEALKLGEVKITPYTKEIDTVVIFPEETLELYHDLPQEEMEYTLFDNKIDPYMKPFYKIKDSEIYIKQKSYLNQKPYLFTIEQVGLDIPMSLDVDHNVITGMYVVDSFKDIPKLIVSPELKKDIKLESDLGEMIIRHDKNFMNLSPENLYEFLISSINSEMFLKLNNEMYAFNYLIPGSKIIVKEIKRTIVFNNETSEFTEAFSVKLKIMADLNEFKNQNTKVKIEKIIRKKPKYAALPHLINNSKFQHGVFYVDITQLTDNPKRRPYDVSIYKTFNKELDDANGYFVRKVNKDVSSYKFLDYDIEVGTSDLAMLNPKKEIWKSKADSEEKNDFVYNVKQHLSDLSYEIALEDALKRLRTLSYIYSPRLTTVMEMTIGFTLDKKWFFLGENFYKAEQVENPSYTAYGDEVIEALLPTKEGLGLMVDNNVFFGFSNDKDQQKDLALKVLQAIVSGTPLDDSYIYQNPFIYYIVTHMLRTGDDFIKFDLFSNTPVEFIFNPISKDNKNRFLFPDFFKLEKPVKDPYNLFRSAINQEIKYIMNNKALDKINSLQRSKITTKVLAVIKTDEFKSLVGMFNGTVYSVLGVNFTDKSPTETINFRFEYSENVIIDSENFTHAIQMFVDKELRLGLYYNAFTKRVKLFTSKNTYVKDYSFLLSLFTTLIHINTDVLDGYKYYSLGEYRPVDEKGNPFMKVEPKYLFLPQKNPVESIYELIGIKINYINKSYYLDLFNEESYSDSVDLGNNEFYTKVNCKVKNDNLVLTKEFYNKEGFVNRATEKIPLITLKNLPYKNMHLFGVDIEPVRLKKFLPYKYKDSYLRNVAIKVTYDKDYYLSINFLEQESFIINNVKYVYMLDGEGVKLQKITGNSVTEPEIVLSLEDIFNKQDKDNIHIMYVDGGKI